MKCEICSFHKNGCCFHPSIIDDWYDGIDIADDDIENGPDWCPLKDVEERGGW